MFMKKIYLILQSLFFVAALCVGFTSCNSEDDELSASNKLMSKKWVYTDTSAGEWSEGAYVQSSSYCLYFLDGQYGVNSWYEKEVDSYFGTDKESGYDFFEYTIQGNSIVIKYFEGGRFDGRKQTFTINGSSIKSDGDTYYAQDYNYSEIRNLEKELAEKLGTASYNTDDKIFTVGGVSFTMKKVTGGTFTMGATSEQGSDAFSDEKPHQVTLSSYYIGETEVTQALWEAVMGSNPSYFKGSILPVEQVSWNDCQKFITKLNAMTGQKFRLPTEAEWEYAARGGNKSKGYKYSGSNNIDDVAWYWMNSGDKHLVGSDYDWDFEKVLNNNGKTHPVAQKKPNELGIYDMSGNVWEWCTDWYGSYSSNAQTNPTGPSTGSYRVDRGGTWLRYANDSRVSHRSCDAPGYRRYVLGLRLAL
jgi:formylglycine-generating enzyme required for sulfatase activity